MTEATKDDIRQVHNRIDSLITNQIDKKSFENLVSKVDDLIEGQTQLLISFTQIQTIQELTPKIELPARPCAFNIALEGKVDRHLTQHEKDALEKKENLRFWQKPLLGALVDMVKMAIIFLGGIFFTKIFK